MEKKSETWVSKYWFAISISLVVVMGIGIGILATIPEIYKIENIKIFSIITVVTLLISLLVREVLCWYWKINKQVKLLESIDYNIKQLVNLNNILIENQIIQNEEVLDYEKM